MHWSSRAYPTFKLTCVPPVTSSHNIDADFKVPNVLPRPMLSDLLGISYRRIPVLAIGNDVYCDTNLISSALERRFPASQGHKTLFPCRVGGGKTDTGLTKALVSYWSDNMIFRLLGDSLPYQKLDAEFLKDRVAVCPFDSPYPGLWAVYLT